jgi:4-diphosphocytidyl-2-C-methyl-D-erythritol kinase
MRFLSPAKVNLHLEVLGRRADGYHEIQTLMSRIDLWDQMEVHEGGEGIRLVAEGDEAIPGGMDNLACRAAAMFCREFGIQGNLEIRIRKRIPVGAGLGGGSGNAATTLMALNDLFRAGRDEKFLMGLGSRLGADVPFFIFRRPALARRKGEELTPVQLPAPLWFLMLVPPFQISTAWAYETYDRLAGKQKKATPLRYSYPTVMDVLPILKNDLEIPALSRHPEIGWMKEELIRRGAKGALMSGSGPVVFGLFTDPEETRRTAQALALPPGWRTEAVRGI